MAGNSNSGRRKHTFFEDALSIELKSRLNLDTPDEPQGVRKLAKKLWDMAESGDMRAAEFLRDTLDGKPRQALEVSGDEDNPLITAIAIRYIDSK